MSTLRNEFQVQLCNARTGNPIDDDSGVYNVLTAGTPAEATIYANKFTTTAADNPGTMTDGEILFYTDDSVTTVDITGLTANGEPFFIAGLTQSQHRIEIDTDSLSDRVLVLPWTIDTSAVSATTTGFDLNALHVVKEIRVKVTTAGGTSNILNVGNSATVSGLFNAVMSATGLVRREQFAGVITANPVAATVSLTINGWNGVSMLYSTTNGTVPKPYFAGAATTITFTEANQTGATGAGYIYMILDKVVV